MIEKQHLMSLERLSESDREFRQKYSEYHPSPGPEKGNQPGLDPEKFKITGPGPSLSPKIFRSDRVADQVRDGSEPF